MRPLFEIIKERNRPMQTKHVLLMSSIFLLTVLSSCTAPVSPTVEGPSDQVGSELILEGTSWDLFAVRKTTILEGTQFTLAFEGGQVNGNAGCNRYFGSYEIVGNQISFSGIGMTEMACLDPEGLMEQEIYLLAFLGDIMRYDLDERQLFLFRADGEALSFNAVQE
jgi:heat shock protein HslJ